MFRLNITTTPDRFLDWLDGMKKQKGINNFWKEEQYKEWREDIKKHPEKIIKLSLNIWITPENKSKDSFIWSSTYERYEKNIKKDKEDKKLGQWPLKDENINNLKYSYVYLKDSGNLIVKKYKIEKFEKSGFDKDFNDPNKWRFIFSKSEDFYAEYPKVVQGPQYGNSFELDNLKKLSHRRSCCKIKSSKKYKFFRRKAKT